MIVYIRGPQNSTRELLVLMNTFSKTAGYKVNFKKKSVALLYTNDTPNEKETRETIPFPIALTNINYLGVILTNQVGHGYDENTKPLKKEIGEDTR